MRLRGINYDTGFFPGGFDSRPVFDADVVAREMRIIADDLHCTSVRISGGDPERLSVAGEKAAAAGLDVWFAPFPCELTPGELAPFFDDCAERAEDLRRGGARTVLVTGCELSLFASGFIPGESLDDRITALSTGKDGLWQSLGEVIGRLDAFLGDVAGSARDRFGGPVTYASGPWERIDWRPFDIVAVDAYRSADNAATFRNELREHAVHCKPVVATEFGCCTYRGAGARGGMGWMIVDQDSDPARLDGEYMRDEGEQVAYVRELLEIFEEEGLDGAFYFTFAGYALPRRSDPAFDLDMASYGIVAMLEEGTGSAYPGMSWEPKEAFHALAAAYKD